MAIHIRATRPADDEPKVGRWQELTEDVLGQAVGAAGDETIYLCPRCADSTGHLYVNYGKGVVHCFKEGTGKRLKSFLAELTGKSPAELELAAQTGDSVAAAMSADEIMSLLGVPRQQTVEPAAPRADYVTFWDQLPSPLCGRPDAAVPLAYLLGPKRRYTPEVIRYFDIRYHPTSGGPAPRFAGRILLPVVMHGKVVYFVARDFTGHQEPKYLNPKCPEYAPQAATEVLFNHDRLLDKEMVIGGEGWFDGAAFGTYGTAFFGKKISDTQRKTLCALPRLRKLAVFFDADLSDADRERMHESLLKFPSHVAVYWTCPHCPTCSGARFRKDEARQLWCMGCGAKMEAKDPPEMTLEERQWNLSLMRPVSLLQAL